MKTTSAAQPDAQAVGYAIGPLIGEGRTAVVHRGRDPLDGDAVAIKIARGPADEDALVAQYAAAGEVTHPHLVSPRALVRLPDGRLAQVMPLVEGNRLADALPLDEPFTIARQICEAIAVLHGRGRLHGDLSPDNVLIDGGAARVIDVASGGSTRRIGTAGFIAPEVLGGAPLDRAAELYALGCVLFEVFFARPVFTVSSARLVHAHLHEPAQIPETLAPRVREVLSALLAKSPPQRPGSAEAMLEALVEVAGDDRSAARRRLGRAMVDGGPLAGQDRACEALTRALDSLERGWGHIVAVEGPPGSGHRTLARWLVAEASRRGRVPVELPVSEVRDDDPSTLGARIAGWVEAARHAPRCVLIDGREADPIALARTRAPLAAAARLAPLLLVVFGDAGEGAEQIAIEPLTATTRRALVAERLDGDDEIAGTLGEWMAELDRPAAVDEALTGLIEAGILVRVEGQWSLDRTRVDAATPVIDAAGAYTGVPRDPAARDALATLAAWGRPLPRDVLAELTGAPLPDALIVDHTDGVVPRQWGVARRAFEALDPETRAALHRRLAALDGLGDGPLDRAWNTYQRVRGGLDASTPDRVAAAEHLAAAGQSRAALAVVEGDAAELVEARAAVLLAQGQVDEARAALGPVTAETPPSRVLAIARLLARAGRYRALDAEIDPTDGPPDVQLAVASARLWLGRLDEAAALARPLEDAPDPRIACRATHIHATVRWQQGALDEVVQRLTRGLERLPPDQPALRAELLRTLGAVHLHRGAYAEAEPALVEAVATIRASGQVPELAKALNNLGLLRYQRGDWQGSRQALEEYEILCGRIGSPIELANVANNLAQLTLKLGEPERALPLLDRSIALAVEAGYDRMIPVARSNRGAALTRLGRYDEAEQDFEVARAGLTDEGAISDRVELDRRRIELAVARGDYSRARAVAEVLVNDPRTEDVPVEAAQVRRLLAEVAIAEGDVADASVHVEAAIARFEALDCTHELAVARETRARVMVASGQFESAILECRRALMVHRALGARDDAHRTTGLLDEAEEHYRHSAQSVRHAEILLELSMTLGQTRDPQAVLRRALEAVCDLIDAERGLVALYDGDTLSEVVTHGIRWAGPGHPLPVSESVVAEARETGRPVVVQDAIDDGVAWTRTSIALLGLRSLLCVPVRRGDETLGVLYLDSSRLVATDLAAETALMTSVARLIGVAVENARLFTTEARRAAWHARVIGDVQHGLGEIEAALDAPGEPRAAIAAVIARLRAMLAEP